MGTQASHAPPVRPWNRVSFAQHTQTPLRAASQREPPELRPCIPPRYPTAGTPVVPLVPLVRSLRAWLALPSPSRWLIRTIRLGYAIQFAPRPPKFRGVHFTSVKAVDTHVLRAEIAVLLAKDAIELVPLADMGSGFYSPYFIVPKKSGGLRPILDLRVLNRSLHKLPFKMLRQKRIFKCIRPRDWFAAIDLKDAYFHVSILPRNSPFLRFAFEGRAYQYKVLPFGLALSPRVFTEVVEGALVPMREQGVRTLNYLDDWLILTQSREQLCEHRDLVLSHLSQLGLVNWEKSKLAPVQRISFLGMELDSVEQSACLTEECAQSVLNCLNTFRGRTAVPLKLFQRLLGHMAAAATVTPLGLLHMRPLQHWLHGRVPRWAWQRGTYRVAITPECRQTFSPWSDPLFLRAGVALEQVSRHAVVWTVDESCLEFGPGDGHVVLSPRPSYVPKVPTTPFRDQVVSLQALPLEEADPALALLCPVRALWLYTDWTQSLRTSDQLFVCYGGQQKGKAVFKQRMAHWIVDAIALAYQAQGVPCPLRLHAHSTRGVASSWALARGASLTDICRAAGWATPNTFARFYSLRVEPVSSRVLTSGQGHGEVPA